MSFTAHDLRYRLEETYPVLYRYLQRNAQHFLGEALKYDAFEVDLVVGHVVEQLVRLGLLGRGDDTPLTVLDRLSPPQFYAFLSRSVRNKAIDRLRKRRLQVSTFTELEPPEGAEMEGGPLNEEVKSLWGDPPFATPEDTALALASREELRDLLKQCLRALQTAPHQLQAVIQEIEEAGADELLHDVIEELRVSPPDQPIPHLSQHKDHAYRRLRRCLQKRSANLRVLIALRLTEYGVETTTHEFSVNIQTLAQPDLSEDEVYAGLKGLVGEGLLDWYGDETVHFTSAQMKLLARFYRDANE